MAFTFGRFELDQAQRTLRLDGAEKQLQPLVFDLLSYLVQNRERVVPKEELLSTLWDGASVTDGSLQRAISLLRGVLRANTEDKRGAVGDLETALSLWPAEQNPAIEPLRTLYRDAGMTAALENLNQRAARLKRATR